MTNVFFKKCHAHNVIIPNKGASCPKCVEQQREKYAGIRADTDTLLSSMQYYYLLQRACYWATYENALMHYSDNDTRRQIAESRVMDQVSHYATHYLGTPPNVSFLNRILSDLRELAKAGKLASVR